MIVLDHFKARRTVKKSYENDSFITVRACGEEYVGFVGDYSDESFVLLAYEQEVGTFYYDEVISS